MVDPHLQERFARRCSEAAFECSVATTAAYASFAEQVFDFWAKMLAPARPSQPALPVWNWPIPTPKAPFPFAPFFWEVPTRAPVFPTPNPLSALQAWTGMFPFNAFPLSTTPPAWPFAFMLIGFGMPHSVAWPTAKAGVAAMDAADAAATSVRQVFASYRTDGGHAGQHLWPTQLVLLAALVPLGFAAMLANVRMA